MNTYWVYIVTNSSRTLYIGVTNDLERRVCEHKRKAIPGFTERYNITRLAWYEYFGNVEDAIACEKRLKGWSRAKKMALIESMNPTWRDLGVVPEYWLRRERSARDPSRARDDNDGDAE